MSYDKQCSSCGGFCGRGWCKRENVKPHSTRKPLTDDEVMLMANESSTQYWGTEAHILRLARAIERAHGIGGEE